MAGKLVWIDLEMTGLDPYTCTIVEIATLVTDSELALVAEGPSFVIHQPSEVLAAMSSEVRQLHQKSGLYDRIPESTTTLAHAEAETVAFVRRHCEPRSAPLAGNSIWKDRQFIERYMPELSAHLHYRNVDVSTVKELVRRWYPNVAAPKKQDAHRALDDILESVAELRWYREHVFIPPSPSPK
jgi:oligoribonuclease